MTNDLTLKRPKDLSFSVIIPNYNGAQYISDCLHSLYQSIKCCPKLNFEVIVVDNGSKDNSLEIAQNITKNFPIPACRQARLNTKYLILNTNHGFAGAVNIGINKSQHEWVVLLNNDLTMEANWFQLVSQAIKNNKNPKISTFFGTVLTKDGTKFESQGLQYFAKGKCLNISNGFPFSTKALNCYSSNALVWGASASLVVYQKKIIQKIGLFDEDFFAYEEDVDLALRLNTFGYKTLYIPKAISYHLGGGTSNRMGNFRNRMDVKNWIYIIVKNYSFKKYFYNFFSITIERLRNFSGLIKNTLSKYRSKSFFYLPYDIIRTYGEVIVKLPKMFQKRHQIKKLLQSTKSNYKL